MDRVVGERRQGLLFLLAFLTSAFSAIFLAKIMPGSLPYRFTKVIPLLMLCAARAYEGRRDGHEPLGRYVGFGLFASFVGDVVIDSSFVAGLGAFLVGHVFYIFALGFPSQTIGALVAGLPAIFYGGFFFWLLVGSGRAPEPLRIPVSVYILIISTMFARATGRAFVDSRDPSARIFLTGAVLFVLSDTLIGIKRWVLPIPHASIWILSTYYAGQWLIYRGSVRRISR